MPASRWTSDGPGAHAAGQDHAHRRGEVAGGDRRHGGEDDVRPVARGDHQVVLLEEIDVVGRAHGRHPDGVDVPLQARGRPAEVAGVEPGDDLFHGRHAQTRLLGEQVEQVGRLRSGGVQGRLGLGEQGRVDAVDQHGQERTLVLGVEPFSHGNVLAQRIHRQAAGVGHVQGGRAQLAGDADADVRVKGLGKVEDGRSLAQEKIAFAPHLVVLADDLAEQAQLLAGGDERPGLVVAHPGHLLVTKGDRVA